MSEFEDRRNITQTVVCRQLRGQVTTVSVALDFCMHLKHM